MDKKNFWNDVAKYGALLGILMGASKVLEQSMLLTGNVTYIALMGLEWLLFVVIFCLILIRAAKNEALKADAKIGFTYGQGVSYMMLVAIFAAVPVTLIYYVYINSIVGYDNYIAEMIASVTALIDSQPIDSASAAIVESTFETLRTQAQPTIFNVLFGNIFNYAFAGGLVGIIFAGKAKRKPQIFDNVNE